MSRGYIIESIVTDGSSCTARIYSMDKDKVLYHLVCKDINELFDEINKIIENAKQ